MSAGKKKTVRRRKTVTRQAILDIALRLADEQGVASLSMRRIAQEVGVEAMSLYNHVANKDDVLDGLLDTVVSEFELPDADQYWKTAIASCAISAHHVLREHPWAAAMMLSRIRVGPASLTWAEATIGCLNQAGFSYPMADHAWNAIDNHIYGFTLQIVDSPIKPVEYTAAAAHYLPLIPAQQYPHLNAMATLVANGGHTGINNFEFGLSLLLDSLERLLDEQGSSAAMVRPQQAP